MKKPTASKQAAHSFFSDRLYHAYVALFIRHVAKRKPEDAVRLERPGWGEQINLMLTNFSSPTPPSPTTSCCTPPSSRSCACSCPVRARVSTPACRRAQLAHSVQ